MDGVRNALVRVGTEALLLAVVVPQARQYSVEGKFPEERRGGVQLEKGRLLQEKGRPQIVLLSKSSGKL